MTHDDCRRLIELVEDTQYTFPEIGRIMGFSREHLKRKYVKIKDDPQFRTNDPLLAALIREHGDQREEAQRQYDDGMLRS
jgi:hypothetical protein